MEAAIAPDVPPHLRALIERCDAEGDEDAEETLARWERALNETTRSLVGRDNSRST